MVKQLQNQKNRRKANNLSFFKWRYSMIYLLKVAKKIALLLKMDCIDLINEDIEREEYKRMRINFVRKVFRKRLGYILIKDMDEERYCLYDKNLTLIRCFSNRESLFQYTKLLKFLGLLQGNRVSIDTLFSYNIIYQF